MSLWTLVHFRELPVPIEQLTDWQKEIMFEFCMEFTEEGIRSGYKQTKRKQDFEETPEMLRQLGYPESYIYNRFNKK